ncbi:hypothetical protein GIB67_001346 [Kingdonia uniflora]|uniref:Uncharacterized protein n=1 Tax=Kingdonia uniflora TaxID=39325 RepID=A0A7J7MTP3_9MAGN|nr:hypothetical protein GIB67_001346 [Kingdonia uniflora]
MKSDKEVNEQVDKENQTQEGRAKKGTSNAKNYTSRCTSLGLHKMFVGLSGEEKGVLHATCFAPLQLIDPIATMSTLVVEIFDRHLAMMPFETDMQQDLVQEAMRYQIEAPAIGVPAVGTPVVVAPAIRSSSSATEIEAVVVRVCSQLEEHGKMLLKLDDDGKMLHTHGKMLERISISTVGDSTLTLGDIPLLGHYQFSTPEKTVKRKREQKKEEDGKMKKAEPRIKKGKGEWQKKAEEADVLNKKKKWKKGEEKDNDDKKDVEEKVKSEEEEVQETMVVAEVAKTDIVFFNQEEAVGETYQASADQITVVSVEEQTLEVEKAEDEASQITYHLFVD